MYQSIRPFQTALIPLRTLHYHVRHWGTPSHTEAPLVLLHGWMDVGASYQFVVDAFSEAFVQGRHILAPDWRGFGLTQPPAGNDHYQFADYLADLDRLLDHYAPDQAVDLVGHSMGGNIAMMYAGVRPQRIRRLINLEGFGMPANTPEQAPTRYAQWLDELQRCEQGTLGLKTYDSASAVARRLIKTNPRLPQDKADWLAQHWAQPDSQGQWHILADAAHKIVNAQLYRVEETLALWRAITAPTLAVEASDDSLSQWWQGRYTLAQYHERLQAVHDCQIAIVQDAGHMLHHDQPHAVAALIESFLART
ncbi:MULTISPECIES: alpha/beta fold hydrolase [Giesbergeria]|uniref:Alpha/beta fold hydrolase n=1 Tax=Giesbergeria sinuosa TaxID=80883 RepID=A0ABV9QBP6_9BURK